MKHILLSVILTPTCLLFTSCSSYVYKEAYPTLVDGQYDSEFPYRGCSKQLEEISETVKRITIMAHYKTYSFAVSDSVRVSDITKDFLDRRETQATYQHHAMGGTGTVVYGQGGKIALLTCAHVVDFQDTVVTRYVGPDYRLTAFVRSFALKMNQLIFLNEFGGGVVLEILALDRAEDLAILGSEVRLSQGIVVKPFQYPLGSAKELEWGSFVYVFGYPAGYQTVTKGIVSLPAHATRGSFIVDAVVSPGSSGSIALAIRDGVPNFELVGIVKMIPAQTSFVLTPAKDGDIEYDPAEPYRGDVFVQRRAEFQHGLAIAIPTEAIVSFIEKNRVGLSEKGYDLGSWIHPPKQEQKKK